MVNFIIRHRVKKISNSGKKRESFITSVFVQAESEAAAQQLISDTYTDGGGITYSVSFDV